MDPEPLQEKLSPHDNPSDSITQSAPVFAPISVIPSPIKVTRTRRSRIKKVTQTRKLSGDLVNTVQNVPATPVFPDSNNNNAEQILSNKLDCLSTDTAMCGEENPSLIACSQNPTRILKEEKCFNFNAPLSENPYVPCEQVVSCASSTPDMDNTVIKEEPTTFLLPLCENGAPPCQQMMPSSQHAPPCAIPDEPPTFMLPFRERPAHLQCQQMMPTSQQVPGLTPNGFPMKIVHFGPPPHLLPMGQYFGHPPMVTSFQPQSHPPMARLMGPRPSMGHFVGPPQHFLRAPNPANAYFRPVFWDPRNPYGVNPYANNVLPPQMFPGYAVGPQPQRRRAAPAKPRKPRRKASNTCVVEPEQSAAPLKMEEPSPQVVLDEISPQETSTGTETFQQDSRSPETPVQETIMDNNNFPQETIIDDSSPHKTIMDDEFPQGAIIHDPCIQGTITEEPLLPQERVMPFSMDVPDMCNEIEVESTLSLHRDEYAGENADDETETEDFTRNLSTNLLPPLDLNHSDVERELPPPSPTPVKTRRMSQKKEHMKLVFDRKSDAMVKAAKGLFTKRTRTLYTWLYPNTSKREVKASVSKAWDLLPESEKAYYLAQVDGRLGIHPGLMVNPQLEGLVKLPEGSTTFDSRRSCKSRGGGSEDGSSSDCGSSDRSDTEHNNNNNSEVARAVRNLFASNGDVETWTSFTHHEDDNKSFRRRKRRKSSSENGNSGDDAKRPTGERDAELECELAKFRQILENDNNLIDEDSYWRVLPDPNPDELFMDIMQE